jgi:hypothetical protein
MAISLIRFNFVLHLDASLFEALRVHPAAVIPVEVGSLLVCQHDDAIVLLHEAKQRRVAFVLRHQFNAPDREFPLRRDMLPLDRLAAPIGGPCFHGELGERMLRHATRMMHAVLDAGGYEFDESLAALDAARIVGAAYLEIFVSRLGENASPGSSPEPDICFSVWSSSSNILNN